MRPIYFNGLLSSIFEISADGCRTVPRRMNGNPHITMSHKHLLSSQSADAKKDTADKTATVGDHLAICTRISSRRITKANIAGKINAAAYKSVLSPDAG
jgi:hypothetical protein